MRRFHGWLLTVTGLLLSAACTDTPAFAAVGDPSAPTAPVGLNPALSVLLVIGLVIVLLIARRIHNGPKRKKPRPGSRSRQQPRRF